MFQNIDSEEDIKMGKITKYTQQMQTKRIKNIPRRQGYRSKVNHGGLGWPHVWYWRLTGYFQGI